MPSTILRTSLIASLALLLGACSGRIGEPVFASIRTTPVAADRARVYFYRAFEPYESLARPMIYLNAKSLAVSEPGGVLWRDVEPGAYEISVFSPGIYPNQFKDVLLRPGDTLYVRIDSLRNWYRGFNWEKDTFVVSLVGESEAEDEMASLRYVPNNGS
jgi:hypothetical protein